MAYLVMPVDAIPDVLVGVGYTDDLAALGAAVKTVGDAVTKEHEAQAREKSLSTEGFLMLDKIDASLRKLNKSAESTKHAVEAMKGLDPKSMAAVFDLIDERVEKTAELIRSEVEESQKKLRRELEEDRRLERKHQKKLLLINIAVASMAVVTFLFQRVLG